MPQIYSSKDAGLPALYWSQTGSVLMFNNYKLILKACLVTGYGGRPAAGWALVDEGDMYLVLRNASGKYLSITSYYYVNSGGLSTHAIFKVWLHASYTGMSSGGVPQGLGVVSGTVAGNSSPQLFGTAQFSWNINHNFWTMIADDRTFIFSIRPYGNASASNTVGINIDTAVGIGTLYVGDDLGGGFIAAGGNCSVPSGVSGQMANYFQAPELTTLTNPKTGLLVDTGGVSALLLGAMWRSAYTDNDPTGSYGTAITSQLVREVTTLEMSQVRWICSGQTQAGLRGVRRDNLFANTLSAALRNSIEGSSTTYNGSTIHDLIPLADGYNYLPLMAGLGARCAMIITDNPEYW